MDIAKCPKDKATAKYLRAMNASRPSFRNILEENQNPKMAIPLVLLAYKITGRSPFTVTRAKTLVNLSWVHVN